ncbi:MAG: hypothetical protein ACLFR0_09210, partial [Alphaproteobacteria bacterium]
RAVNRLRFFPLRAVNRLRGCPQQDSDLCGRSVLARLSHKSSVLARLSHKKRGRRSLATLSVLKDSPHPAKT